MRPTRLRLDLAERAVVATLRPQDDGPTLALVEEWDLAREAPAVLVLVGLVPVGVPSADTNVVWRAPHVTTAEARKLTAALRSAIRTKGAT